MFKNFYSINKFQDLYKFTTVQKITKTFANFHSKYKQFHSTRHTGHTAEDVTDCKSFIFALCCLSCHHFQVSIKAGRKVLRMLEPLKFRKLSRLK